MILKTVDGGSTWTPQRSGTSIHKLCSIFLYDKDVVWITGDGGTILYTDNGGSVTAIDEGGLINARGNSFRLSPNYPNPFNPSTQITYSVPKATNATLKVYDVLGREIAVLVNERKQPGEYKVTWNAEGVPSGVYFYRLVAGDFIGTKKMVVMK
jgi:hypothetical protein